MSLCDKELKIEESKQVQRHFFKWKGRKKHKLERDNKVLSVSEGLRKKLLKKSKDEKKKINTQRQVTNKVTKKPIGVRYKFEMEEPCIFCLKKRQQST